MLPQNGSFAALQRSVVTWGGRGYSTANHVCCKICQNMKRRESSSPTIPVRYARGIAIAAEKRGLPVNALLERAGIDRQSIELSRARLSLKQFSRFFGAVADAMDDESVGLGQFPVRRGTTEIICRAAITGTTLAEAAAIAASVLNAVSADTEVRFEADLAGHRIRWKNRLQPVADNALFYEVSILTIYAVLSWLIAARVPLLRTDFPFPQPRHLFELRSMLPGRLCFDQEYACLWLAPHAASMAIRKESGDISKLIRLAPASLIEGVLLKGRTAVQIRDLLRASFPVLLTLDDVACKLALSASTLHRKLQQEGETFQSVKDHLRRDMAIYALTRTSRPLKQIAHELGFSDQSTFQRAFTHWTGGAPGAYREVSRLT